MVVLHTGQADKPAAQEEQVARWPQGRNTTDTWVIASQEVGETMKETFQFWLKLD